MSHVQKKSDKSETSQGWSGDHWNLDKILDEIGGSGRAKKCHFGPHISWVPMQPHYTYSQVLLSTVTFGVASHFSQTLCALKNYLNVRQFLFLFPEQFLNCFRVWFPVVSPVMFTSHCVFGTEQPTNVIVFSKQPTSLMTDCLQIDPFPYAAYCMLQIGLIDKCLSD